VQLFSQLQSGHRGHVMVQDQASQIVTFGRQELTRRCERLNAMSDNLQQEPQRIPDGLIIVYDADGPLLDLAHASIPKALAAICLSLSEAAQGSIDPDQPPAGGAYPVGKGSNGPMTL
jgi:hypothetical protein